MEGQMSIFDFPEYCPTSDHIGKSRKRSEKVGRDPKLDKPRAPIWHFSLNHVWEECPNCKAYNKGQKYHVGWNGGEGYWEDLDRCPVCDQKLDWSEEAIEKACKYSRDYLEAQARQKEVKE